MTSASSADPLWGRLTAPAKAAVRWAAAIASTRGPEPSDSFDLFAGIMLAHLRDSPPRQLLEHFGVPAGAVLGRDGASAPRLDALLGVIETFPADEMPPLGPEVGRALEAASDERLRPGDDLISLGTIFGGLLGSANPAAAALRLQLALRGADPDALTSSYPEFLAGSEPYAEFLRRRHPYRPEAVQLPA